VRDRKPVRRRPGALEDEYLVRPPKAAAPTAGVWPCGISARLRGRTWPPATPKNADKSVAGSGRGQTLVDIRPDYTVAIMMATVCYVSSAFAVALLPESSARRSHNYVQSGNRSFNYDPGACRLWHTVGVPTRPRNRVAHRAVMIFIETICRVAHFSIAVMTLGAAARGES